MLPFAGRSIENAREGKMGGRWISRGAILEVFFIVATLVTAEAAAMMVLLPGAA